MARTVKEYLKKVEIAHGADAAEKCRRGLGKAKTVSILRGATLLGTVLLQEQGQTETLSPPTDTGSDA